MALHVAQLSAIPATTAVVAVLSAAILYAVARGVYNVFLHPLAKVPGPKLYAVSDVFYIYHLTHGNWPQTLKVLHDQYGPVVRFAPTEVSFVSVGAWKDIYGHKNDISRNYPKCDKAVPPSLSGVPNLLTANDADHRRMRKLLSHAFSEKALRSQESTMNRYIDLFINKLTDAADRREPMDMVKWFNFLTFDLIGDLAFGEPFGGLESGSYHPWVSMIFSSVRMTTLTQVFRRHPILQPIARLLTPRKVMKDVQEHWQLSQETALRRINSKDSAERNDFMSYILRYNDEKGMSQGEIIENTNILIIAGSETTATTLSGTTYLLATNPDAYHKLVKEIRSTFTSEEDITLARVGNLEYMRAVFDETFRMYPPVPIGLPRIVPQGGDFIEGYWMPPGTAVSVPQWPAYQSDKLWTDPQEFIPERWLGDERFANDARGILQPFSVGPRNCIGMNLAHAETRLILARMLWRFDIQLRSDSINWKQQPIYTLWDKGELNVKISLAQR
ncbi:cytochrome P450 [Stachybotrys elegans]|uniref:Cytochrome P450 n=1 Tax=Stachybotrys elegans TaxID=80388 RepID=A0A8K0WRD8_9HYPO|nr:cytochrome P450 [Stachybotrys elegans]